MNFRLFLNEENNNKNHLKLERQNSTDSIDELFKKYFLNNKNTSKIKKISKTPDINKFKKTSNSNLENNKSLLFIKGKSLVAESLNYVRPSKLENYVLTERIHTRLPVNLLTPIKIKTIPKKNSILTEKSEEDLLFSKDKLEKEKKIISQLKKEKEIAENDKNIPDWAKGSLFGGSNLSKPSNIKLISKFTLRNGL